MQRSIRSKLVFAVIGPLVVIYAAIVAMDFSTLRRTAYDLMEARLQERTNLLAERLNEMFGAAAQAAGQTAVQLSLQEDPSDEDLYRLAESTVRANRLIYGSCIAFDEYEHDRTRRLFAPYVYRMAEPMPARGSDGALRRMEVGQDAYPYLDGTWAWFTVPKETLGSRWTDPYFDRDAGNAHMVTYSTPFSRRSGHFRGVVTVDVRIDDINAVVNSLEVPGQEVSIVSSNGLLLAHPNPQRVNTDTLHDIAREKSRPDWVDLADRVQKGHKGVVRIRALEEDSRDIVAYAPIPAMHWSLVASVHDREIMAPVFAKLWQSVALLLAGLLVIGVVIAVSALQIIAPLKRLARAVKSLSRGDLEGGRVPVTTRDEIGELGHAFNQMTGDLRHQMSALAKETAARQKVEDEMDIGRQIQAALMPASYPSDARFDVAGLWVPAGTVGGDFIDCFLSGSGDLALLIADVSGKGIPAAIFMARARTVLHETLVRGLAPAEALTTGNHYLVSDNAQSMFVTALAARYRPDEGVLRFAVAGHPPPVLVRANDGASLLTAKGGTLLGAVPQIQCEQHEMRLEVGDTLVMYTDGVSEARDGAGAFYTSERFAQFLAGTRTATCKDLCARIAEEMESFQTAGRADDLTLLALRRTR